MIVRLYLRRPGTGTIVRYRDVTHLLGWPDVIDTIHAQWIAEAWKRTFEGRPTHVDVSELKAWREAEVGA